MSMGVDANVLIVGAGPAGLGVAAALKDAGVERVVVLDRHEVGASFLRWPREMRLLTPSFPNSGWGQTDLNGIAPLTSPGWSTGTEHLTGEDYAVYLRTVVDTLKLEVKVGCAVTSITRTRNGPFRVGLDDGRTLRAPFVIWAAGEFQYPRFDTFSGAEHCRHNATISAFSELTGERFVVIGDGESAIDSAIQLAQAGRQVDLLAPRASWDQRVSDPSRALVPFTLDRLRAAAATGRITPRSGVRVERVERSRDAFSVHTDQGTVLRSDTRPINATGFDGSVGKLRKWFAWHAGGWPLLTSDDESTKTPGLFLVGPQVRHEQLIFCFIYKFRGRFPVVASAIAKRLEFPPTTKLDTWRRQGMWLDDLSCCGGECSC